MGKTRSKRRRGPRQATPTQQRSSGAPADGGHAVHFLQRVGERIGGEAEELALQLYHKPSLVRAILEQLSLPDGVERIALELPAGRPPEGVQSAAHDGHEGPWAIVTRGGSFVTCLARGMDVEGAFRVGHERLLAHRERIMTLRERVEGMTELADGPEPLATLALRAMVGPVSREEFQALEATVGLTGPAFAGHLMDALSRLRRLYERLDRRPVDRRRDAERLLEIWKLHQRCGNLLLLLSERSFAPLMVELLREMPMFPETLSLLARPREVGVILRLVHFLASHGKLTLPGCKRMVQAAISPSFLITGLCGLVAIGARNAKLRGQVAKVLRRFNHLVPGWTPLLQGGLRGFFNEQSFTMLLATALTPEELLPSTQGFVDDGLEEFLAKDHGAERLEELFAVGSAEELDRSGAFALHALTDQIVPPVRDDANMDEIGGLWGSLQILLSLAARKQASDFFFPHRNTPPPDRRVSEERQLKQAAGLVSAVSGQMSHGPRLKRERIGRNDPCSCGSGLKYKRCCGTKSTDERMREERAALAEEHRKIAERDRAYYKPLLERMHLEGAEASDEAEPGEGEGA